MEEPIFKDEDTMPLSTLPSLAPPADPENSKSESSSKAPTSNLDLDLSVECCSPDADAATGREVMDAEVLPLTPPSSPQVNQEGASAASTGELAPGELVPESSWMDESQPVVLESPGKIDIPKEDVNVAPGWRSTSQAIHHPPSEPTWQCAIMRRLKIDENSSAGKVWKRWVAHLEKIARCHVNIAFNQIWTELRSTMESTVTSGDGDMHAVLAMAGSDVADHEATMRQAEGIVRKEFPKACIATVGPESFRNLATVIKHICEQIMACGNRVSPVPVIDVETGETAETAEGEWPEDLERHAQKAGLNECLDWYEKQQARDAIRGVVLLVERVEAVPRDVLRDALGSVGIAFGSKNVPVFVILGLQHWPQGCFDLFEGKPLANLRLLGATQLFDSRVISNQMLEWLVEDPMCMLVLPPNILDWLRRGIFDYTRQSVSYMMNALTFLCLHFFAESTSGLLCAPLDDRDEFPLDDEGCESSKEGSEAAWTQIFHDRLQEAPQLMEHLKQVWITWSGDRAEGLEPEALRSEIAQAATQAACWRLRLIASFNVWDALCCAVQPMTRHEPRLRRLCRLFEVMVPKESNYDSESIETVVKAEQEKVSQLVKVCISKLSHDSKVLSDEEVMKLLQRLGETSAKLDESLKAQLDELKNRQLDVPQMRSSMQEWLHNVQSLYWVPLQSAARIVFREIFLARVRNGLHVRVEASLGGGKMGYIAETPVRTLAAAGRDSGKSLSDAAVLYRLLECSSSRAIEVADLWKTFCECMALNCSADAKSAQSAGKSRFGYGLLALHSMGLIAPQPKAGGKAECGNSFDHWRLKRKHFGRVWLKATESANDDDLSAICAAVPAVTTAADLQMAIRSDNLDAQEPKQLPRWAQAWLPECLRGNEKPASMLKRHAPVRPTAGFDPSAKRARGAVKSRPRIFMA
jgi:hypothetical protein